mgnify:CR=1 FL=1
MRRLPKTLTREEATRLLAAPNKSCPTGLRNRCILQLMYRGALRVSEVVALRPQDIDWETGLVRIVEGKGARDRNIYIDEHTLDLLRLWSERRPRSPWFFCTLSGRPVSTVYIRAMIKRMARRAGITRRIYPHMLRHTFATERLSEGWSIREVQEYLGHADIRTTQIYTHVSPEDLRRRVAQLRPLTV